MNYKPGACTYEKLAADAFADTGIRVSHSVIRNLIRRLGLELNPVGGAKKSFGPTGKLLAEAILNIIEILESNQISHPSTKVIYKDLSALLGL